MDNPLEVALKRAAAALKAAGAREVYLFGSAAAGTMGNDSDIDLAVTGLPPEKFFQAMAEAADILQRPLDLVDLDEHNFFTEFLKKKKKLQRVA